MDVASTKVLFIKVLFTFVIHDGEVGVEGKLWHGLKEEFVASGRIVFVHDTDSLDQLQRNALGKAQQENKSCYYLAFLIRVCALHISLK